jgi:hypothetical protein
MPDESTTSGDAAIVAYRGFTPLDSSLLPHAEAGR